MSRGETNKNNIFHEFAGKNSSSCKKGESGRGGIQKTERGLKTILDPNQETLTARLQVRSYELDSFGHVNNAVYLQYLEAARCDYLLQKNLCFADFFRWERYPLLIKAELNYKATATADDILLIHGRSIPYRKLGFILDYEIEKEGGGLILSARLTFVFTTPSGRPAPVPEEFRRKFLGEVL